ncbi:defensin-like protein 183 [Trifolium pratense]|uniref:defensin-like protein 183 n=1 Tax=Trifolium pratense TaxID=57577 RepID=UPI001E69143C|nr:defensin-like protein 183 [Trifolium pratense]
MVNQMSKSFCFFAILVLFVAVQLIQVEGECTKVVGDCGAANCASHCNSYARGARVLGSSCSFNNLCTCTFDRPPPGSEQPACDVGMGLCTRDCQDDCCNNKCVSRFTKTGHGSCVDAFNMILCLCSYNR